MNNGQTEKPFCVVCLKTIRGKPLVHPVTGDEFHNACAKDDNDYKKIGFKDSTVDASWKILQEKIKPQ